MMNAEVVAHIKNNYIWSTLPDTVKQVNVTYFENIFFNFIQASDNLWC